MGVPAFFRWLTKKYPSVICDANEEKGRELPDGRRLPIDTSLPNPNGVEFDNLYLDMNGIIHPCTHPEDRPAPKNEDEMMVAIFEFIDRIFAIVRPRKLLYMAIDGVAPRAKMNQQRSRRFRASKEVAEKVEQMAKITDELRAKGCYVPPQKEKGEHFDSNCITPGTPFMHRLSKCLHYYVHNRLRDDPGWKNLIVILSDANVPGEGEHKIMDYIRRQRAQPNHDPNTKHVLCGADADLIMLGLATHEPHFTIIREEFTPNKPRPCDICNQLGHEMKDCQGAEKEKTGEFDEIAPTIAAEQKYIFVRLYVLREYLERELAMPNLPFPYDLERAIDDWVFMCFFVGNDFLPHLPSLEIREDAIDRLVRLYKDAVYKTGGWLTESGFVALERVQLILNALGDVEDEIFRKRQQNEVRFLQRQKQNKRRSFGGVDQGRPAFLPSGQFAPRAVGRGYNNPSITNARQEIQQHRQQAFVRESDAVPDNNDAAAKLRAMLKPTADGDASNPTGAGASNSEPAESPRGVKRKAEEEEEDEFAHDEVRLWEEGFKERYYESKFGVGLNDIEFRSKVATEYVRGLCWVLQYYYQGVPSWKWFFPYHYAPFASDFQHITEVKSVFTKAKPFLPLEQLMGVFPAASRSHVPDVFGELMVDPESSIIDFYPEDFKIDLNGKKFAWQGVALLPFVDETRLKRALKPLRDQMTEEEKRRNQLGEELVFCGKHHPGYSFLRGLLEGEPTEEKAVFDLNPEHFHGFYGHVLQSDICVEAGGVLESPVRGLDSIYDCHVACLFYRDPIPKEPNFKYPAQRLPGAITPPRELRPGDHNDARDGQWAPRVGMAGANRNQRGNLHQAGHRMIGHYNQPRPPTVPPFRGGPGGAMSSASAYFDLGNQHGGGGGQQGRDWNRSGGSNYPPPDRYGGGNGNYRGGGGGGGGNRGGRGGYAEVAPPAHRGGGGYGGYDNRGGGGQNQPRRYADIGSNGPPAAGNYRGGGGGSGQANYGPPAQSGYRHQGPPQQQQQPRHPPPRGGGNSGYGYYTSNYEGNRY